MAPSTSNPGTNAPPSNVQVIFRDDLVEPELRRVVERSIVAMAARAGEEFTKRRAVETERARLLAVLTAARKEQVEPDPELVKAFEDMRAQPLIDFGVGTATRPEPPQPAANPLAEFLGLGPGRAQVGRAIEVTVPPNYHFFWSWGSHFRPPVGATQSISGFVGLTTQAGAGAMAPDGFFEAHAGYGLVLRTDHTVTAIGRSFKKAEHEYSLNTWGDGHIVTEGGLEFTVMEDGVFKAGTPVNDGKIWRLRASGGEGDGRPQNFPSQVMFDPRELVFTMNPGHEYTFNVGAWVGSEAESTLGAAAVTSMIKADVLAITIER
jgi:hypothetical protein